jgi:Uncharacterised protein conserved in bacteria (DUF2336)
MTNAETWPTDSETSDFATILRRCRERAAAAGRRRAEIAEALRFGAGAGLSDRERALLGSLYRQLLVDIEAGLRRALNNPAPDQEPAADALAATMDATDPEILRERLDAVDILDDDALVEALYHRLRSHELERSLTGPPGGLGEVAPAGAGEALLARLARTADRRLAEGINAYLVDRARRLDAYQNPRLPLRELDPATTERLHWAVAAAIEGLAVPAATAPSPDLGAALAGAVAGALERGRQARRGAGEIAALVEHLLRVERPMVALGEALRHGEVPLFDAALIRWSGLAPHLARRLVFEPGLFGLAVLCRARGAEAAEFAAIAALLENVPPGDAAAAAAAKDAQTRFAAIAPATAARVLRYWRLPGGLLRALRARDHAVAAGRRDDAF